MFIIKDLGPLANYIDYERYGRDIAMDEQGRGVISQIIRTAKQKEEFDEEQDAEFCE